MQEIQVTERRIALPGVWDAVGHDHFSKAFANSSAYLEAHFTQDRFVCIKAKVPVCVGGVFNAIQTVAALKVEASDRDSVDLAISALERRLSEIASGASDNSMRKFTVFGINEDTGELSADHVWGVSLRNALISAAAIRKGQDVSLVAAIEGWREEGVDIAFSDDDSSAADVFSSRSKYGDPAWELTAERVQSVLEAFALRVTNTNGTAFAQMAAELIDDGELDCSSIVSDAMAAPRPDLIEQYGFNAIKQALVDADVLEF